MAEDDNPFRRFYEQGGYVSAPSPGRRLKMALWGSQYMADGGSVSKSSLDRLIEAMLELRRACGGRV